MVFLSAHADYFTVELKGSSVRATHAVWAGADTNALAELFLRLAVYERPWSGDERWESIEGDFSLCASCSPLGEVNFQVCFRGAQGAVEDWQVSAALTTEFGQLPEIAADARRFFGGPSQDTTID